MRRMQTWDAHLQIERPVLTPFQFKRHNVLIQMMYQRDSIVLDVTTSLTAIIRHKMVA
jgi:hypothetical protein